MPHKKNKQDNQQRLSTKQVIVMRKDLNMRKGKLAAQAAHASMMFLIDNNESDRNDEMTIKLSQIEVDWFFSGRTKIVCGCNSEEELRHLVLLAQMKNIETHVVIDAGHTEFHGQPTVTCAAFGPDEEDAIDSVTGNLKLL